MRALRSRSTCSIAALADGCSVAYDAAPARFHGLPARGDTINPRMDACLSATLSEAVPSVSNGVLAADVPEDSPALTRSPG